MKKRRSISLEDLCGAEWEPESERKTYSKDELAEALERFAREVRDTWPEEARWYVEQAWDSPTSIEVILEAEPEGHVWERVRGPIEQYRCTRSRCLAMKHVVRYGASYSGWRPDGVTETDERGNPLETRYSWNGATYFDTLGLTEEPPCGEEAVRAWMAGAQRSATSG